MFPRWRILRALSRIWCDAGHEPGGSTSERCSKMKVPRVFAQKQQKRVEGGELTYQREQGLTSKRLPSMLSRDIASPFHDEL
jgi:hypothetical protein